MTPEAYRLMHDGCIALSEIEANGIRIDVAYLDKAIKKTANRIAVIEEELREDPIYRTWSRKFGDKTNLGSREQLAEIIFGDMGFKSTAFTKTGRPQADEKAFQDVDLPFVQKYFKGEKLKKAKTTYLEGIRREVDKDLLHPFFDSHTTLTYRLSSSAPNFHNMPIRDPMMGELIRKAFIPREGRVLVEVDFSGIEVRVACCYHEDPNMIRYIEDPTTDMHRDMAAQIYCIDSDKVGKKPRYYAKNLFVFPQFYGDYYVHCAKNMWDAIKRSDLKDESGQGVFDLLKRNGITKLGRCDHDVPPVPGTFEHHMKDIEDHFWNVRFPVYGQWKKRIWKEYQRDLGFMTLTGFWIGGIYNRKEVINYGTQGSASQCLEWCLIRMNKEIRRREMRSLILGPIHDSIVSDVPVDELDDFMRMAKRTMTKDLLEAWKWINVPLEIEIDVAPVDASWFHKREVKRFHSKETDERFWTWICKTCKKPLQKFPGRAIMFYDDFCKGCTKYDPLERAWVER